MDDAVYLVNYHPLDSDVSVGWRCPALFEQLGPDIINNVVTIHVTSTENPSVAFS